MSLALLFEAMKANSWRRAHASAAFLNMARFAALLALMLALPLGWAKEAVPAAEDPQVERRMVELSEDLRCLVCQNETIAASRADFANDLRREIREQIKADKTDKEIVDFLVARYGDFVLYRPPFKSTTLFLWAGPFIFLLIGATTLFVYLRRRRQQIEEPVLTEQQRKQAEALLKESEG